jgi:hypothetical protein
LGNDDADDNVDDDGVDEDGGKGELVKGVGWATGSTEAGAEAIEEVDDGNVVDEVPPIGSRDDTKGEVDGC